jgi:hypothetical protein
LVDSLSIAKNNPGIHVEAGVFVFDFVLSFSWLLLLGYILGH